MTFPVLYPTVSLILGILASSWGLSSFALLLPGLGLAITGAWILFVVKKTRACFFLVLAASFVLGAMLKADFERRYERNALRNFESEDYVDFIGRLARSPSREPDRDILLLRVEKILSGKRELAIRGNLRLTVLHPPGPSDQLNLCTGDTVKVSAQISPARDFQNFSKPFLSRYLKSQNIHGRAFSKSPLLVEKIKSAPRLSLFRLVSVIRQRAQQKLEHYFPSSPPGLNPLSPEGAMLEALLIGEVGRMDEPTSLSLQKTGLYHLIAISGAQIAIISMLLFSLLRLLGMAQRPSYLVLMSLLALYAVLVEGSPSVLRATIMALTFLLGKLIWRDVNLLNTISLSAIILLLANPLSLFDLGFELTYAATLSIILFYERVLKHLPRLPLRLSEMTAMSVTAQLGVMPFMAASFNRVTFSALLLNYAAVPLFGTIMAAGYLFFPLSFIFPPGARLLARGLMLSIQVFIRITHVLDGVPFASYRIPTPHLVTVCGYFLFLGLLLCPPKIKRQRLIVSTLFASFFIVLISYPFPSTSKNLKLTFIDVGQGDSILIQFPGHKKMLIDGGGLPGTTFDIGERVVSPVLWHKGIKRVDFLVLTHAHQDHVNGLAAVARNFAIGEFWETGEPVEDPAYAGLKASLPRSAVQKKLSRRFTARVGGVSISALHPGPNQPLSNSVDNDRSLVLRLSYGRTSFLLAADVGLEAEEEVLLNCPEIRSQVLKAAHHGSNTSTSELFLSRVAPEFVVISVGRGNRFGFPQPAVLERLKKCGAKVFRTDLDGAIEIGSDGLGLSFRCAARDKSS